MKFTVILALFLSASCSPTSQTADSEASRRQGVSYTTNVLHENPNFPDQQAQSSIDFHLGPLNNNNAPQGLTSSVYEYSSPKSIHDYQQSYQSSQYNYQPAVTQNYHKPKSYAGTYPSYPSQSQSFNVGYSVKFTNGHDRSKSYKAPRLDGDIITGSRKEEVKKPPVSFEEIDPNIYFDPKKQKVTVTKTKYSKATAPYQVVSQAHVTPTTERHLAYLETVDNNARAQASALTAPWQNTGTSVEIYKSREIELPALSSYDTKGFDHARALGKSEGFDYSNAIDLTGATLPHHYVPDHKVAASSGIQNNLFSSTTSKDRFNGYNDVKGLIPKLPIDTSLIRNPVLTTHKEPISTHSKHIPIHFDTSLIQQMSKQYSAIFDDSQTSPNTQLDFTKPINVYSAEKDDTSLTSSQEIDHEKNLKYLNNILNDKSQPTKQDYQSNESGMFFKNPTFRQPFPESNEALNKPTQAKLIHKPKKQQQQHSYYTEEQKPKMYMVNENVHESNEPKQTQFQVFVKPKNAFMRHEYEKYQRGRPEKSPPRQPRINQKRVIRDYNIETDLKPPPMAFNWKQRRIQLI